MNFKKNKLLLSLLLLILAGIGTLMLLEVNYISSTSSNSGISMNILSSSDSKEPCFNSHTNISYSSQNTNTSFIVENPDHQELNKPKIKKWNEWPAMAYEEVGHPLITKGDSFFHHARDLYFQKHQENGKTLMDEFIQIYKNRPDPVNLCGIRINHALALFLAVKYLKPTLVVESGVNAGVSTYFIRSASPTTKIFAIDPLEQPICGQSERWVDTSPNTINYTGKNFVDLMELDWKGMVSRNEIDLEKTLVFIDDHLHAFKRIAHVMKFGVRHVIVEDNYKLGEGATPNDKRSTPKQMFYGKVWEKEGNWLWNNIVAYAEFPPIVPPIMAKEFTGQRKKAGGFMVASDKNDDIVHPILRPDLNEEDLDMYNSIALQLNVDPSLKDDDSYMQFMNYNQICHLELLPIPPSLLYAE